MFNDWNGRGGIRDDKRDDVIRQEMMGIPIVALPEEEKALKIRLSCVFFKKVNFLEMEYYLREHQSNVYIVAVDKPIHKDGSQKLWTFSNEKAKYAFDVVIGDEKAALDEIKKHSSSIGGNRYKLIKTGVLFSLDGSYNLSIKT